MAVTRASAIWRAGRRPEAIITSDLAGHRGRPTLTIDLDAVVANWRALDALGPAETAAAIKADGYGLGSAEIGPALVSAGCRTFFTATADEARALRAALGSTSDRGLGHRVDIFVLNGAPERFDAIAAADASPVLNTAEELRAAAVFGAARGVPLRAALQVETGMNRLGADLEAVLALPEDIRSAVRVDLLMSHLACADDPKDPMNAAQKQRFDAAISKLKQRFPEARASLSATGGALAGADFAYDMVRPGVGLYGGFPFTEARPVAFLAAPIIRVFDVAEGESSGYGGAWVAKRPSVLATIPLGYADGMPRALSNRGVAKVGGVEVPFAGRVSMDLIVLDCTEAPARPKIGDPATLLDGDLTVDRIATAADTIGYEILTRLGRRYRRVYRTN
ncbi:MAG: alanine racemase [Pseudomonadota bacterium]